MGKLPMFVASFMIACLAVIITAIGPQVKSASAADKVYRMKIQSLYPRGDLSMETLKVFADSAAKNSSGQLQIKIFAEPELVPGDQLFGATKQGVVDMLQGMGGMWGGIVPVGYIEFNLPLAFSIPEEVTFAGKAEAIRNFYLKNGFMDLLREEYAKQGFISTGCSHLWSSSFYLVDKAGENMCRSARYEDQNGGWRSRIS